MVSEGVAYGWECCSCQCWLLVVMPATECACCRGGHAALAWQLGVALHVCHLWCVTAADSRERKAPWLYLYVFSLDGVFIR